MGPPGSPKGATEVLHGTSRQPQGSHRGAPWDLKAAPREPHRCPMGPPGSSKGATGVPQGTSRHPQGSHRGPKGATRSCKWYLWESESGCLILGVQVQDSESGRENLGVQSWEFLMSDSVSPNMPDRIWCPNQSLTIDSMFLLFWVSRCGHFWNSVLPKLQVYGPPWGRHLCGI